MLQNSSICVSTTLKRRQIWASSVILVPYSKHHVPKYNQWMQNEELQYLTGSEPLNLDDEYQMLQSWTEDTNKCTFIVLDRSQYISLKNLSNEEREIISMIGDVNFYIVDNEIAEAEIEIMIAEPLARGKGFGREAVLAMMHFGYEIVKIQKFVAKIKMSNVKSQRLFSKHFGFLEVSRSNIFEEVTYESDLTKDSRLGQLFAENFIEFKLLD